MLHARRPFQEAQGEQHGKSQRRGENLALLQTQLEHEQAEQAQREKIESLKAHLSSVIERTTRIRNAYEKEKKQLTTQVRSAICKPVACVGSRRIEANLCGAVHHRSPPNRVCCAIAHPHSYHQAWTSTMQIKPPAPMQVDKLGRERHHCERIHDEAMQEAAVAHQRHVRELERERATLTEKLQAMAENVKDAKIEMSTRVRATAIVT